jgi:parallel beta-helix repeat protein
MFASIGHTSSILVLLLLLLAFGSPAFATVRYVDGNNTNATPPYTNWDTAATIIQQAVDAAMAGDEIVVTNGIYTTGGRAVRTNVLVNRVAVDKPLAVRSVNGPQFTVIQGYQVPGTTNGDGAIRCVYLADGASLSGFTLTNGATRDGGDWHRDQSGGGLWCESAFAFASNCVMAGNSALASGGGAYSGTLNDCALAGNSAGRGGGAASVTLNNCTLTGNSAQYGGGALESALNDCALIGNTASDSGGGAWYGSLSNCMLTGNSAVESGGGAYGQSWDSSSTLNNCVLKGNSASYGGGAHGSVLTNCTLTTKTALSAGGGVDVATLSNCVLTDNSSGWYGGAANASGLNHCTLTGNSARVGGGAAGGGLRNCIVYPAWLIDSSGPNG